MLPLIPPYPINELAPEPREGRLPDGRPRYRHDPDRFEEVPAPLLSNPDPAPSRGWGWLTAFFDLNRFTTPHERIA